LAESDCLSDGWEYCTDEGFCEHKEIFPLKELELWGFISIFAALWLANMGGVGGGGMCVPIGIAFFKLDPKNAIALSNFSIFLSSAIRYILNAPKSHPLKNGKGILVDMNLAVIMLPLIISGVSFGVMLNIIMPDSIIVICFVGLLTYLGYGVLKKGLGLYKKETDMLNAGPVVEMAEV
jgi:uncharacterized membrane protein YfcA